MITEYGDNLHVLLTPKIGEDWESFASWYSTNKNLPYASKSLVYAIEDDVTPFQIFQWAKRLEMQSFGLLNRKDKFLNLIAALHKTVKVFHKPVLIVPSLHMVLKPFTEDLLAIFNSKVPKFVWDGEGIGFCNLDEWQLRKLWDAHVSQKPCDMQEDRKLIDEAKETDSPKSMVSYKKGCGKWIHKMKGCPFASAGGLISEEMTINEQKIIELWRKMVPLYSSIN